VAITKDVRIAYQWMRSPLSILDPQKDYRASVDEKYGEHGRGF